MKKLLALLLVLVMSAGMLASCAKTDEPAAADPTPAVSEPATTDEVTPDAPPADGTVSFTDSTGREVEIPSRITKISPTGALAQMFLIAIAPDLLVSVSSEYSAEQMTYLPDYLAELPVVGQFYGSDDLNYETIASIGPELVIDVGEPKGTIVEDMDSITTNLAIPSVHITATLRSTPDAFRMLGKLLGREEKGEELALFCEKILAQTDDVVTKVGDNKVTGLYLLGDTGQNVIAANSYHSEVIDYIMDNIAVVDSPSGKGTGNETDLEQISIWNPDIIFFAPNSVYADVAGDAAWQGLTAITSGSFYETPFGPYNWFGNPPSINRYLSMMWLTKVLYPDYAEYDLYEQVKEYYNLFYGYDLTQEDYNVLTANSLPA